MTNDAGASLLRKQLLPSSDQVPRAQSAIALQDMLLFGGREDDVDEDADAEVEEDEDDDNDASNKGSAQESKPVKRELKFDVERERDSVGQDSHS